MDGTYSARVYLVGPLNESYRHDRNGSQLLHSTRLRHGTTVSSTHHAKFCIAFRSASCGCFRCFLHKVDMIQYSHGLRKQPMLHRTYTRQRVVCLKFWILQAVIRLE